MGRLALEDGRCTINCQPGPESGPLDFLRSPSPEPMTHRTLMPTLCADLSGLPSPIALSARAREQSSLQAVCSLQEKMSRDFHSGAQGDPLQPIWPPCLFCRSVADVFLAYCLRQTGTSHLQVQGLPLVPSPTLPYSRSFPQLPTPTSSTLA